MWKKIATMSVAVLTALALVLPKVITYASANAENYFPTLEIDNLVENGDFSLDSDSDGLADGYLFYNMTPTFITNTQSFIATAQFGYLYNRVPLTPNNVYYYYTRFNASTSNVYFVAGDDFYYTNIIARHSDVYQYETFSGLYTAPSQVNQSQSYIGIRDASPNGWNNVDISYLIAINITSFNSTYGLSWGKTEFDNLIAEYGYFDDLSIPLDIAFSLEMAEKVGNELISRFTLLFDLPMATLCVFNRVDLFGIVNPPRGECERVSYVFNLPNEIINSDSGGGGGFGGR